METKEVRMEDIHRLEKARIQLHNFFEALHIDYNMYSDITQTMWKITHSHYFVEKENESICWSNTDPRRIQDDPPL